MNPLGYLFWWAILGLIPWQVIYLKRWAETDRDRPPYEMDILQAMPFGLIVLVAILITWVISMRKGGLDESQKSPKTA